MMMMVSFKFTMMSGPGLVTVTVTQIGQFRGGRRQVRAGSCHKSSWKSVNLKVNALKINLNYRVNLNSSRFTESASVPRNLKVRVSRELSQSEARCSQRPQSRTVAASPSRREAPEGPWAAAVAVTVPVTG
jgi:hypothetical protein